MQKDICVCFLFSMCFFVACSDYQEEQLSEILYGNNYLLQYDAVNENDKHVVWQEEFSNNDSKFPFDISKPMTDVLNASIENGILMVDYIDNSNYFTPYFIPFVIDTNCNVEIEIRVFITKTSNSSPKVLLNFIQKKALSLTEFTMNGLAIQIIRDTICVDRLLYNSYFEWSYFYERAEKYILYDDFNIITFRKINDKCTFFVNHKMCSTIISYKYIHQCDRSYLIFNNGINKFDYVRVSYISLNP